MVRYVTPFLKQAIVTSGVSINLAQFGIVSGYVMGIVPQLMQPGSPIHMDSEMGSWFASIQGFTLIIGNLATASIMGAYGRWVTNVISSGLSLVGWICIVLANNVTWLLMGRIIQGINLGLILSAGPIMIGEYTSPRYRGLFLSVLTLVLSLGTLLVHILSVYLYWRSSALLFTVISFVGLVICIYCPETPCWLADKGKYKDCEKVYRWLRGNNEEEELNRMLEASSETRRSKSCIRERQTIKTIIQNRFKQMKVIITKQEVYKPLIITIHLFFLAYWSGLIIWAAYPDYVVSEVVGKKVNMPMVLISIDLLRVIVSTASIYIVKKFKRKTILLVAVGFNIAFLFLIAGYAYARSNNWLPFEQPFIGIIFIHMHMLFMSGGALPLPLIISGEIYPLQYRSFTSGITNTVSSLHLFLTIKTFPTLVKNIKIHGAYVIYGLICTYSLVVAYIFLPETKDKTLQDIEEEFKGKTLRGVEESAHLFLEKNTSKLNGGNIHNSKPKELSSQLIASS